MKKKKEYAVGEVFRHTDGKLYRCVEDEHCEGCAFEYCDSDCRSLYCCSFGREDGRSVKFIAVTEPAEGMLYRAENGRMYRLAEGSHWDHWCACDDDPERSCAELDMAVFGGRGPRWYWAPTTDYAPASDESSKPVESPKRHIELAVVKVERDEYRRNLHRIAIASGLDFGEPSKETGLPKDIVVASYCKSSKREHAPQAERYIQLVLPLREIMAECCRQIGNAF